MVGLDVFSSSLYGLDFVTGAIGEGDNAEKHFIAQKFIVLCQNDP